MRASRSAILVGLMCLSMQAATAAAQNGFILRYGVGYVNPTGEEDATLLGDSATLEYDSRVGFFLNGEYKFTSVIGIETTVLFSNPDISFESDNVNEDGDGVIAPIMVGPTFHFTPDRKVDFYVSPFAAYVIYDNINFDNLTVDIDSDLGYGGSLAITVPIEESWTFDAAVRYVVTKAEPEDSDFELDVDPWIFQIGAGYRF